MGTLMNPSHTCEISFRCCVFPPTSVGPKLQVSVCSYRELCVVSCIPLSFLSRPSYPMRLCLKLIFMDI